MVRRERTEKRAKKITAVVKARQKSLNVVIENVHDPHNVSAIFRTCDAVGVPKVSLVYNLDAFPKIGKKSSASAFKWVDKDKFHTIKECYDELHSEGYTIYASAITDNTKDLYELDFSKKAAIVLGNEHRGISDEAAELADERFMIPMYGMVQSLNVSVAAAVVLYEVLRQRKEKGMYDESEYSPEELEAFIDKWCNK